MHSSSGVCTDQRLLVEHIVPVDDFVSVDFDQHDIRHEYHERHEHLRNAEFAAIHRHDAESEFAEQAHGLA